MTRTLTLILYALIPYGAYARDIAPLKEPAPLKDFPPLMVADTIPPADIISVAGNGHVPGNIPVTGIIPLDDSILPATDTVPLVNESGPVQQEYLRLNLDYLETIPQAFLYTVKRPFHWKGKDWKRVGIAGLAIGTSLAFDYEIKQFAQANRSSIANDVAGVVEPFGNNYFPFIMVGMLAVGKVTKDRKMEHASLMGARSLLVSTAVYTTIKGFTRRNRPVNTNNTFDFHTPFKPEYTSFPSGHTNTAISVATALALEYRHIKWVPVACYTVAGLTAVSRIYDNRHWTSDVVVGGLMGHFITRGLYYWEQKRQEKKLPKMPPAL